MDQRHKLAKNYNMARVNLLMMTILTAVNIILYLTNSDSYFPFSAVAPQIGIGFGIGMGSETAGLVTAVIIIGVYLVCYLLSKKKTGWLIASLVMFSIDCLLLVWLMLNADADTSFFIDILFHIWVLYYLVIGVVAAPKLKKLDEENELMMSMSAQTKPTAAQPEQPVYAQEPVNQASDTAEPLSQETASDQSNENASV